MPDLRPRELWAVAPLVALIIVLGVYPKPLLDVINPAVRHTLVQVHATDPRPQHRTPSSGRLLAGNGDPRASLGAAQIQKGSTP